MKKTIFIVSFILANSLALAQTPLFKVKQYRADEPVTLTMSMVSANIEGYNGDEIIIETVPSSKVVPPEAAGLKQLPIPGRNKEDNLMRPRLQEDDYGMQIIIPQGNFSRLSIKVPQTILLFVKTNMNLNEDKIRINNINSIDIEGILGSVEIKNVTNFVVKGGGYHVGSRASGRVTLSDIKWTAAPVMVNGRATNRTYIASSTNSDIEISVPKDAKVNMVFCSDYGRVFSNLGVDPVPASWRDSSKFVEFFRYEQPLKTLLPNGRGVNVIIKSVFGNIYFKKE